MKKMLLGLGLLLTSFTSYAFQPLPADQAFAFKAHKESQSFKLHWNIAPGYYLYRDRVRVEPTNPLKLPAGIKKQDDILGTYQVYKNELTLLIPTQTDLIVHYQGCAASGFCYPPIAKKLHAQADGSITMTDANDSSIAIDQVVEQPSPESTGFMMLLSFFGLGLLLAFTPCVLPLLPILSSIIVGQSTALTTKRAFLLSLSYVLAMAVAYAGAGVVAGLAGSYVQAFLQNAWVLGAFSLVFVLLAFSLFGFYELQLPASWQEKLTNYSNRQSGGTYIGVAIMGALSILIVSPCVTVPLMGALTYIGKTGNALLGGTALFVMGLGFGVPLLIVGTLGGKFLPKAGRWMNIVKAIFGVMMLLMAIWLLIRIPAVENFVVTKLTTTTQTLPFKKIKNVEELNQELALAKAQYKPVMLDFYADWCVACKQMERTTFSNPKVQAALKDTIWLQADVTANDQAARQLAKQFGVIAPPTILFFDTAGQELKRRIVGEMDTDAFLRYLENIKL